MKSSLILFASALLLAAGGALAQGTPAAGPTDAQIAHIVVTANQVDIDAGKLAESKGKSKDVKAFGKQMVTDHSGVNKQAVALVKKLKGLKGAEFDKAYTDHEVAYHEQVLGAIDKTLVPNAKNEELKALIVKVRPAFVAHLEHAKMIQAKLGK